MDSRDAEYFGSVGATMPMDVGPPFCGTVSDAAVVSKDSESGEIDSVAIPVAVFPDGSVTL